MNCMPATACSPTTSTLPPAPPNTAKVPSSQRPLSAPSDAVQLSLFAFHAPSPSSIAPLLCSPATEPSQNDSTSPALLTRFTCPSIAVCTNRSCASLPTGSAPISSPLSVSAPP